ncbi:MAG: aminotransferase class I/II-fold pyridoxal phosphate-dependent enzyme [Corynebacterium sp.]|nr:aminotransferase class I/II-fold pyridoxal phosphate-dependent enzyme [Corynebacterium sp.]
MVTAVSAGNNQYAPARGVPELRAAIAADRQRRYAQHWDPETDILVTVGATEALTASIIAITEPGDEVIVIEPYYDVYATAIALAGCTRVAVPIEPTTGQVDPAALREAITSRTKLLVVNSPHNPTGLMLNTADFAGLRLRRGLP